jgi:hypothetical protein
MAVEYEDQYKHLLKLSDTDAVMAEIAPCMIELDEVRVRDAVQSQLAAGKGI